MVPYLGIFASVLMVKALALLRVVENDVWVGAFFDHSWAGGINFFIEDSQGVGATPPSPEVLRQVGMRTCKVFGLFSSVRLNK